MQSQKNKLLSKILILILIFSCCAEVFAKKNGGGKKNSNSIAIVDDGKNAEGEEMNVEDSWQLLEWIEETPLFVYNYEVIVEQKMENGEWKEIRRLETEDNKPSVTLSPALEVGTYRYKVVTINLIGLRDVESDWEVFEIYRAYTPRITSVNVNVNKSSTIYFDEYNDGLVSISGRNLFSRDEDGKNVSFTNYFLLKGGRKSSSVELVPLKYDGGKEVQFQLDLETLDTGTYNIVAEDASGLRSDVDSKSAFYVKFRKAVDFEISAGYFCPVIVFDDTIDNYMGGKAWPISLMAKTTLVPIKRRFGYFGIGLEAYYTRMNAQMEDYEIEGNLASGYATVVYQIPFVKKNNRHIATLEVHGGVGLEYFMNYQFHFPHNIDSEVLNSLNPSIVAGGAVKFYITSRLFVEANVDFCVGVMKDMGFGVLRPGALVGWQF